MNISWHPWGLTVQEAHSYIFHLLEAHELHDGCPAVPHPMSAVVELMLAGHVHALPPPPGRVHTPLAFPAAIHAVPAALPPQLLADELEQTEDEAPTKSQEHAPFDPWKQALAVPHESPPVLPLHSTAPSLPSVPVTAQLPVVPIT